jgi:hypothetical protein
MNILQSTFEKHKKLMLESLLPEIDVTREQNMAIKKVYIIFRNLLKEMVDAAIAMGVTPENATKTFYKFWEEYDPVHSIGVDRVKVEKEKGSGLPKRLVVSFPESIRKDLPNLGKTVYVTVLPMLGDSNAEFNSIKGVHFDLVVRFPKMLKDFDAYKVSLQHEMQHLVSKGGSDDENEPNKLLRTLKYQVMIQGELEAHAKQYAYMYHKKFKADQQLDFEKFKKEFYRKGHVKLDNYINFGEDSERLRKQYNLTPEQYKIMTDGYKTFVTELKKMFLLYRQK